MAKKRDMHHILVLALALSVMLTFSGCASRNVANTETNTNTTAAMDEAPHSDFQTELVEEGTVEIVGYLGKGPVVEVPETVLGLTVVSIGSEAFAMPGIEEIILPDTVTTIASYAFKNCSDLRSITFGNNVKRVENFVFQGCPLLEKVIFPETLRRLGNDLFGVNEVLTEVYIPAGVSEIFGTIATASACPNLVVTVTENTIGHLSSASAGLTLNILPNSENASSDPSAGDATISDVSAKDSSDNVIEVITEENTDTQQKGNSQTQKDLTDESLFEIEAIGANTCVVTGCSSESDYITVPETIQDLKVIRIGTRAFEGSDAITIAIPDSVTYIESYAFSKCDNLESVTLSRYLEKVGELIFNECPVLKSIIFPNDMTTFEGTPIGRCTSLQIVYIPDSVTDIPENIVSTSLCPDVTVVTPAGSTAEKVALEREIPVSNEVSGG